MNMSARLLLLAIGLYALSRLGQCQDAKQLTPRQLFYLQLENRPKPGKRPVPRIEPGKQKRSESPLVQNVALVSAPPLVLRYSLRKRRPDGEYREVDPDSVFHSGDRIRINVQANDSGYLYIAQRGSSGTWKVLFPSSEIAGGDNRVERLRSFEMPPKGQFRFEEPPGTEELFIVLSRNPEPELEKLIYGRTSGGKEDTTGRTLIAQNLPSIDDALVNRIRSQLQARDLVFEKEKVDESTNDKVAKNERAVYVVNATRRPDEPVIIDLRLKHE